MQIAGGQVVHPALWMSLSGLPQRAPDRDTRGYFDARGRRVWLDVFPPTDLNHWFAAAVATEQIEGRRLTANCDPLSGKHHAESSSQPNGSDARPPSC